MFGCPLSWCAARGIKQGFTRFIVASLLSYCNTLVLRLAVHITYQRLASCRVAGS